MKRLFLLLSVIVFIASPTSAQSMTAGEVVDRIKKEVTCEWNDETVDTFKSGGESSEITGIATTFLATLDVLKQARAQGLNMVITHEPTFYNHFDKTEHLEGDKVLAAKQKFIEDNNMVVWRFHDHWHQTQPDGIYEGMAAQLGWKRYQQDKVLYTIPQTTLAALAAQLKELTKARTIRVLGDPDMQITKVGLKLGSPGTMPQIYTLQLDEVEVLVGGEGLEWETVEYVRDAISAGMNKALIFLGHATSEEPGMEYCAEWLKGFVDEVPIAFIPAGEPFWAP